jgi:hypothetical protein
MDEKKENTPQLNEEIIKLITAVSDMGYEVKSIRQGLDCSSKIITLELFQCLL